MNYIYNFIAKVGTLVEKQGRYYQLNPSNKNKSVLKRISKDKFDSIMKQNRIIKRSKWY